MLNELQQLDIFPLTTAEIILNISVALICGLFIAWLYRFTYRGPGYSVSFVNSIVLLAMITAVVIMVIGNNLARAFGLVGAMSIIRFRTAVKETLDIVYIFFGLTIGMAAGVGYHQIAIIGTLFIGAILVIFSRTSLPITRHEEYLIQFLFQHREEESPPYLDIFKQHCRHFKIVNVKSMGGDDELLELSYYVKFKDKEKSSDLVRDLKNLPGVQHINLFFDEEQF